jgi:phage terminase large subunit-like protein
MAIYPMSKVDEVIAGLDLGSLSEEGLRKVALLKQEELRKKRDGLLWLYEPQEQQIPFHKSDKRVRWIFGGNRSGKSIASHVEVMQLALGIHPYRKMVVPNHGWVVSVDFQTSTDVSEFIMLQYLPKSKIKHTSAGNPIDGNRVITLTNGSTIGFKSADSGATKFQGTSRHWILYDEEPPYDVYNECNMRLIDTNGLTICAETPTLGMSWTFDEIVEMEGVNPNIEVFHFSMLKNPHLKKEAVQEAIAKMSDEEKEMRIEGKHIQLSGQVFKEYDREVHVIDGFEIPNSFEWSKFRGIDHGTNNPTACVWVAINREGDWYIYDEYYESDKTIAENCTAIKTISGGDKYDWTAIDGSTKNTESVRKSSYYEEYKKNGIYAKPVWLNEVNIRLAIDSIRQLLKKNEKTAKPKLYIFRHCTAFLKEFSRYRWKSYRAKDDKNNPDKPQGYMDHAITAFEFIVLSRARWQGIDKMQAEPETIKWY